MDTAVTVDVRNLFSVRVVRFEVNPGPPKFVDVTFELQADKTRATQRVSVAYGRFPTTLLEPASSELLTATKADGSLKDFDVIKQSAWNVVRFTTDANKLGAAGTHADMTWNDIRTWVAQETSKPSIAQTLNMM